MLPIWTTYFAGYYILVLLVAFGWTGRAILVASLSIASYYAFRHAINHHSLKSGDSLSEQRRQEARDYVISIFQAKEVTQ